MKTVDETLAERGKTHGSFAENANISQRLKNVFADGSQYINLTTAQVEAIEVIFQKLARLITGAPNLVDTARDVNGYAKLLLDATIARGDARDVNQTYTCKDEHDSWIQEPKP
jgi:hypothetical protein